MTNRSSGSDGPADDEAGEGHRRPGSIRRVEAEPFNLVRLVSGSRAKVLAAGGVAFIVAAVAHLRYHRGRD